MPNLMSYTDEELAAAIAKAWREYVRHCEDTQRLWRRYMNLSGEQRRRRAERGS